MSSALQPFGDYVVAVAEEAQTKTASGLYLPENAAEKPKIAKVVAIGPGRPNAAGTGMIPVSVSVGARIVYKSYSTTEVKIDGTEYILVKEEDILATVK